MFKEIFSLQYLFGPTLPGLQFSDKLYFQFGILLVAIGLALLFFTRTLRNPVKKHLLKRWQHLTLTIGFLAIFWTGMRYELIRFFSMHVIVWIVYLAGLIWAGFILKYWLSEHKQRQLEHEKEEIKKRYL